MVISKKKHGIPMNKSIMAYGIKNAPPPCLKHKYGNLQTFPKPENVKKTNVITNIDFNKNHIEFLAQNFSVFPFNKHFQRLKYFYYWVYVYYTTPKIPLTDHIASSLAE